MYFPTNQASKGVIYLHHVLKKVHSLIHQHFTHLLAKLYFTQQPSCNQREVSHKDYKSLFITLVNNSSSLLYVYIYIYIYMYQGIPHLIVHSHKQV